MTGEAALLAAFGLLLFGAFIAGFCGRRVRWAGAVAVASSIASASLGIPPALSVLSGGPTLQWSSFWSVPWGSFSLTVDPLSAFFLIFIFFLAIPIAAYGRGYLDHQPTTGWQSLSWSFYLLLELAMVLLVSAADGLLFLISWEGMSVASLLLVLQGHEKEEVRRDGWAYAIATHLGAAALLAMFAFWGGLAGSLHFGALSSIELSRGGSWAIFLLSLAGFGSKAGLVPFHVWLPRAHPSAPSHVSALLSGVMIKMGVYGLLRVMALCGPPRLSWGVILMVAGGISCIFGVVLAIAQHDLKRLLAYHSVENVGIIVMGIGGAALASASGAPAAAGLLSAGAILHVLNHGLFKGLLFCAGGSAAQSAGTREISAMGGLLRRMPLTGAGFLIGSMAICALPPFNGLVSEILIYSGLLSGAMACRAPVSATLFFFIPLLALSGGLALLCFAKVFGVAFLGEPRTSGADTATESSSWMTVPVILLALACAAVGLASPLLLHYAQAALLPVGFVAGEEGRELLWGLSRAVAVLWGLIALLSVGLYLVLRRREVVRLKTWGCGFSAPTARMQYTASSFAAPLLDPLVRFLRPDIHLKRPDGFFPRAATFHDHLRDPLDRWVYDPLFSALSGVATALRPLQQGRLPAYVAYIMVALVVAMLWGVFS